MGKCRDAAGDPVDRLVHPQVISDPENGLGRDSLLPIDTPPS